MMPKAVLRLHAMDYYLCANGAKLYDAAGTELFSQVMSRDKVQGLMEALSPLGARWNVHSEGRSWIEREGVTYMVASTTPSKLKQLVPRSPRHIRSLILAAFHRFVGERGKRIVGSIEPVVAAHETFEKVGCSFTSEEACERAVRLIGKLGGFEVARVWERELEITDAGITKGSTAEWLMAHLGIERERSVAFGDSKNDAPLIGYVGRFVAMGNASDDLKAMADEVCEPLSRDGVARWIEAQIREANE